MSIRPHRQLARIARSFTVALSVVCGAVLLPSMAARAAEDPSIAMKTLGGELRVASEPFPPHLVLNKKKVLGIEDDSITLKQKFNVAGNDVVLVQHNCSGSSCSYSTLNFLTISSNGKVTVSEDIDADESGTAVIKAVGDTLIVKTETFEGRRKKTVTWTYANGKVSKSK